MGNSLHLLQNVEPSKGLLEYTHFGYMWTNVRTKKIVASHTVYALVEAEPFEEFFTEETWRKYVHPHDLYKLLQCEEKLLTEGNPVAVEYRLITKSGKHIFINHHMQLSISYDNEAKILSILDDITEQKHAEVILEIMNDGFFELDKKFEFRRINTKAEFLWEIHRENVIGESIWKVFPNAKNTAFYELIIRAVHEKISIMQDVIGPVNNHWLHISAAPYRDGTIVIFHDIQNEKLAEQEITKHHNILKQAEELAGAGSWEYNVNTKEFVWSDGMYKLFEMEKGQSVQPSVYTDYATEGDRQVAGKITDLIQEQFQPFEETVHIKPNGTIKALKIKATVLADDGGIPSRVIGVDMDITAAKNSEEKITRLNRELILKNRELESLSSELKTFNTIAANDYRETLKHLYTSLEFIVTNDAANFSNAGKANIRRAQSAIQKMKLLTDDIVAYSKLYLLDDEKAPINLNNILKTVQQDLERKITETDAVIECEDCPVVDGYPLLLSLLFHHLIDNAIKFRKENISPVIKITSSEIDGANINHVSSETDMHYKVITVSDNGVGFNEKEGEIIFGMFVRLHEKGKYKGSGIGLAICKKIMDIHDGFITATSEEGNGSVFNCFFPTEKLPPPLKV